MSCRGSTPELQALASQAAVHALRGLTGHQVGGCPITVTPCLGPCWAGLRSVTDWRVAPVMAPRLASGTWVNLGCGVCGTCPGGGDGVYLGSPVGAVRRVTVNGVTVPAEQYRLHRATLYRLDGTRWPTDGSLQVTLQRGLPVDGHGAYAAGVLAVEYARGFTGGPCVLPVNTVAVARAGVSITLDPSQVATLPQVESYVTRFNPNRLTVAPRVFSPDRITTR